MDLQEALDKLETLKSNMATKTAIDIKLDDLSQFLYSDLDDIVSAVNDAVKEIDSLIEERDRLQRKWDETEV